MAVWKLAPALAAGNAVVLKPAEQTPGSILMLMELIGDLLPPGVLNVVNGFGVEAGKPLASSQPDRQDRLHRRDHDRPADHAVRQPRTSSRSRWSSAARRPNIFFDDVAAAAGRLLRQGARGLHDVRPQPGRGLHLPVAGADPARRSTPTSCRDAIARVEAIMQGNPLDTDTMIGAQASNDQLEKILSYIDIGKAGGREGAHRRRARRCSTATWPAGYYVQPTDLRGRQLDADLPGGDLRPGRLGDLVRRLGRRDQDRQRHPLRPRRRRVDPRRINTAYRAGRAIQAGRVWTNCYHAYPAHAAFGGYKQSGIGRENHKMMLDHYQQTKNLLVSYSPDKLGFF